MIIRKAEIADVPAIVSIHQQAFPDFFLTTLGRRFLRLYYKCMCTSEEAVTFCAEKEERVVGFATCSYYSRGFNLALIRDNLFPFCLMAIELLFTKPGAILRLAKNLDKKDVEDTVEDTGDYAELYSIAVLPDCQGAGIGKELLKATEDDIAKHNRRISLTTDYDHNEMTIGFYHSQGYQDYYAFITYPGRRMWRLIKEIKP